MTHLIFPVEIFSPTYRAWGSSQPIFEDSSFSFFSSKESNGAVISRRREWKRDRNNIRRDEKLLTWLGTERTVASLVMNRSPWNENQSKSRGTGGTWERLPLPLPWSGPGKVLNTPTRIQISMGQLSCIPCQVRKRFQRDIRIVSDG